MPGLAVPVLETDRLILRGHRVEDFASCAALWADPEVTRFISTAPLGEEEAWARFLRYAGHWAMMGYGFWAVEEKGSGRYLANVGFANARRAIVPPLGDDPEIGWVFAADAAGRGYATEAVLGALQWGDRNFEGGRTVCIVAPEHGRSIRVAEKAGYHSVGTGQYHGLTRMILAREAPSARDRRGTTSTLRSDVSQTARRVGILSSASTTRE